MWKDIIGFEGLYQINEYGEVKSLSRVIINNGGEQVLPERILKAGNAGRGYLKVDLRKDNQTYRFYVHDLVGKHFIENPLNLPTVNHKDGNKHNNYYENLEWVTYSENNQHAYDNDLHGKGIDHYNAKLTEEQVKEIIIKGKGSSTYKEIGDMYGVAAATIRDILYKNTWKHIHAQLENSNDYSARK